MHRRDFLQRGVATVTATGLITGLAGCSSLGGSEETTTTVPEGTELVEVGPGGRYAFSPGTQNPLQITPGTTVRFVWQSDTHNVNVTEQPADADWTGHDAIENEGFSFETTFTVPGTYEYACEPHESLGMVGTIVVEGA